MTERTLLGLAAAGGIAVGRALVSDEAPARDAGPGGPVEQERALVALAKVAAELAFSAGRLRDSGLDAEADILEASGLIAQDAGLVQAAVDAAATVSAEAAVRQSAEEQAEVIAALPDPLLAARAADIREIGRRAAAILAGRRLRTADGPVVLVARELGPSELAELRLGDAQIVGVALAAGAVTSHAAIMARAFGVPMVVGAGEELLKIDNVELVVDGDSGTVVVAPTRETQARAVADLARRARRRRELALARGLPAVTRDGVSIRLLCNACTAAEVEAGLAAGAEGVGLLRTELAFLDAARWPTEAEHVAALAPPLSRLEGRVATVRTFDFGADKTPPFLVGEQRRGLDLALAHVDALAAQLRAILRAGAGTELRLLLPMVETAQQLREVRELLAVAVQEVGWTGPPPAVGAMIETPDAARHALDIALEADFLSIGTNDLVQYTLGLDREQPLASARTAADPRVLALIRVVGTAGARTGLSVEVCGEAASEPPLAVLLIGAGVGELSVAPARLDEVRAAVRSLDSVDAERVLRRAVTLESGAAALELAAELLSDELGDEPREVLGGLDGVVA
jgi:phosphoenolpyruvate-protein kinase (PTS system EI component)